MHSPPVHNEKLVAEKIKSGKVIVARNFVFSWLQTVLIGEEYINKEAIWLYAELFLGHHDGSCHGLW